MIGQRFQTEGREWVVCRLGWVVEATGRKVRVWWAAPCEPGTATPAGPMRLFDAIPVGGTYG